MAVAVKLTRRPQEEPTSLRALARSSLFFALMTKVKTPVRVCVDT